ncbi:MAG TPA: hypothetical protein VGK73_13030, partial [Polyangiaceae bacterium]
ENVEAAERAIDALRSALARQGTRLGARIRWRFLESGGGFVPALLARTLEVAREACAVRERAAIVEHARRVDAGVENAARGRIPDGPGLAADLGRSAGVDVVFGASSLPRAQNPALALRALYATGYLLGEWDEAEVTLELPPLEPRVTPPA